MGAEKSQGVGAWGVEGTALPGADVSDAGIAAFEAALGASFA